MKKIFGILSALAVITGVVGCNTDPASTPPDDDITPLRFEAKAGFVTRYDEYPVDTAGVYFDKPILSEKRLIEEITTDTALSFEGKTGVSLHVGPGSRFDTSYFSQDANGDLWSYNYGFSMLNNFEELKNAAGGPINMKWVLLMKFGKKEGATWIAKADSLFLPSFGSYVHLRDTATMMADTVITVGTEQIECRHARHRITASTTIIVPTVGTIVTDVYVSAKYGKVVWDFVRSGSITGAVNAKVQGVFKIMTYHE